MESLKLCPKCNVEKSIEEFVKNRFNKSGIENRCKECNRKYWAKKRKEPKHQEIIKNIYIKYSKTDKAKEKSRRNHKNNKEKELEYGKKYYHSNKEKRKENIRKWNKANPEKYKLNQKKAGFKRKENPLHNLQNRLRNSIKHQFKRNGLVKKTKTFCLLETEFAEYYNKLSVYLNKLCEDCEKEIINMSNCNLDHIVPSSLASSKKEIILLNQPWNLRLICVKCNLSKSNKICLPIQQTVLDWMKSNRILIKKLKI